MQSKNAIGNLKNRYMAVLKKCNLINVFGSLAVVGALTLSFAVPSGFAAENSSGTEVKSMDATNGLMQFPLNQVPGLNDPTLINNGTVKGGALYDVGGESYTIGMFGGSGTSADYSFTNNNLVDITANLALATGSIENYLSGMFVVSEGNHTLMNEASANITLTNTVTSKDAEASANVFGFGMMDGSPNSYTNTLTNKGSVTISNTANGKLDSESSVYGIIGFGGTNNTLTNEAGAAITITNELHSVDGYFGGFVGAMNIQAPSGNHSVINMGTIDIINKGTSINDEGEVVGFAMLAQAGSGNLTATNNGTINILTEAKSDGDSSTSSAAIMLMGDGNHNLTNNATITIENIVHSTNGGAGIEGLVLAAMGDGDHRITNNGTITMTSTTASTNLDSFSTAMGMSVQGTPTTQHILTNTGVIDVKATATAGAGFTAMARAYEAYGLESFTVDTWATTLRTWSADDAVFGMENGKVINFANGGEGATLILRPGTEAQGFVMDQEYEVANMVAIADATNTMHLQTQFATGAIEGSIEEVKTEVNYLTANFDNSDPTKPTVSLSKNANADLPTQTITAQSVNVNLEHIKGVKDVTKNAIANVYNRSLGFTEIASNNSLGLSAGSTAYSPWTVFATTYGSYTDNSKYDYDSGLFGVSGGITYNFTEQFALGGHLNFNTSNADSKNFESDSTSFAFGAHSQYFINPNWYVNGSASFAFGNNDVKYSQSIGIAKDEFSSFSAFASLSTGYVFELNKNNIIVPEVGLSYLHAENDKYTLDFGPGNEMYKFDMHDNSYDNLYVDLSLTWQGNYNLSSSTISPSVGVGVRQNLTGSDIDASYDLFNNRYETQVSSDETIFLTNAGLKWTKNNFTVSADYEGEFGSQQTSHTGSLNFTFKF